MNTSKNIIWCKGPLRTSYSFKDTEYCSNELDIIDLIKKTDDIIFIRNGSFLETKDLNYFVKNIKLLKKPVILITSDGDRPVPSSYSKEICSIILNCDLIKYWYTTNYDKSIIHHKLKYLPIGFDFHTKERLINNNINHKINFMFNLSKKYKYTDRISNSILSDTHFSYSHKERKDLYDELKDNPQINFIKKRLSYLEISNLYHKYNFVLSPRGRGLDCYRTWELFLAGCIVILRTSPLDDMYLKNNLPVVILKNWKELNYNLADKLKLWYKENIGKTSKENIYPKLKFDYWLKY